jgi:hypothetical protein
MRRVFQLMSALLFTACAGTAPAPAPPAPANEYEPEPVEPVAAEPRPEPVPEPPPPQPITGRSYGQTIADGTTFTIVALSPEDAFYEDSPKIVNLRCTASGPLTETGTGLYGGSARCSDGEEYTFYQVSLTTP